MNVICMKPGHEDLGQCPDCWSCKQCIREEGRAQGIKEGAASRDPEVDNLRMTLKKACALLEESKGWFGDNKFQKEKVDTFVGEVRPLLGRPKRRSSP